jgi:hypothetical protein
MKETRHMMNLYRSLALAQVLVAAWMLSHVAARPNPGGLTVQVVDRTATVAWDKNLERVDGYRVYWGTSPGVYSGNADAGNVTQFTTPQLPLDVPLFLAVTAYRTDESTFSNEVSTVVPSTAPDYCAQFGTRAVALFITRKINGNGAVGSREGLLYQISSAGSPVVAIQPMLNGQPAGPGERGADLTWDGGIWFPTPTTPGTYTLTLDVTNAAGCKATGTKDAAGRLLITKVK